MPNHVSHRCTISGPAEDVARFRAAHIIEKPETRRRFEDGKEVDEPTGETFTTLDFDTIVPMPKALHVESSSIVDQGVSIIAWLLRGHTAPVLQGRHQPALTHLLGTESLGRMLHCPWVKEAGIETTEQLAIHLLDRNPDCLVRAAQAIENVIRYGFKDWYEWSVVNWGTKWGAYDFSITGEDTQHIDIVFDTAWSHPEPIFHKLVELFPTLSFKGDWRDEGGPKDTFHYGAPPTRRRKTG